MPEDLVIVGAGGSAGDIAGMVEHINQRKARWRLVGFLDDDAAKHGCSIAGYPVLGSIAAAADFPDCRFVVGMAHYRRRFIRRTVVERMGLPAERFATLIHPMSSVSRRAKVGAGTIVFENAVVSHGATLGNHVYVGQLCYVGHDAVIEDWATMAPGSGICGGGRLCSGAYAGARSTIRDGVTIGAGALVAIGSVVIHDVGPDEMVIGNPASTVAAHAQNGGRR
jgi:sugar O-acyltransferase (sialic acid O-acetyltransferase NeuD family)